MKIDIISVQPKMFAGFLSESIVARAVRKGACEIAITDLRDFGEGRWKKVDDKPYGGGPGMLMKCGPWFAAVESCLGPEEKVGGESRWTEGDKIPWSASTHSLLSRSTLHPSTRIIMTTPAGKKFTQRDAEMFANLQEEVKGRGAIERSEMAEGLRERWRDENSSTHHSSSPSPKTSKLPNLQTSNPHLIFLCGHYEGFDARIETLATDKFSVGDFVMTGGELAAAAMTDAIVRLLPGVLGGGPAATSNESFSIRETGGGRDEIEQRGEGGSLGGGGESRWTEDVSFSSKNETFHCPPPPLFSNSSSSQPATFLEAPQYTHPPEFRGMKVPEVLLSGDHAKIEAWRAAESRKLTAAVRPDLLERAKGSRS